LNYVVRKELIL